MVNQARLISYGQQAANDGLMTLDLMEDKIINFSAGVRDPEDENDRKRRVAFNFDIPETKERCQRLFLHVPIYENTLQFALYRVYSVPTYNTNAKCHGFIYETLLNLRPGNIRRNR